MAPSGNRKDSAPSGPRGNRSSTTRGGISKRRGNHGGRVDRDGDLDMDASIAANRSSRKGKRPSNGNSDSIPSAPRSSRPTRATARTQQLLQRVITESGGNLSSRTTNGVSGGSKSLGFKGTRSANAPYTTLQIEGFEASRATKNEGGGLRELIIFLERKAQHIAKTTRPIRIMKPQKEGDFVYITTNKEDGEEILKLNGFLFAGANLTITDISDKKPPVAQTAMSSTALEIKEQLRTVLSQRYDINAKLLSLSALGEDPILNQMGFFSGESKPEKLFRALMAVCDGLFKTEEEKRNAVSSISLAGNNIDDVLQIMSLTDTFPDLANLDLSRNQFKNTKGLQKWRYRLRKLETLLLNDNPIETMDPSYQADLIAWFPKLQNLSGIQVRTPEQIAAEEAALRPNPIPQHGIDFRDIGGIGEGFLREFVPMYDADRPNLAAKYYDNESTFSVAINNANTSRNSVGQSWAPYLKFSRNHVKITTTHARVQRLFTGLHHIQSMWQQLPPTRHPDLATEFHKYIIDCHPVHGLADPTGQSPVGVDGMVITMHGQFEDQDPGTMKTATRSFTRTFILGPAAPGGNVIRVISDVLALRAHDPLPALPGLSAPPVPPPNEDMQKQQMVIELCNRTGMTPEYSHLCLDGVGWNFDQALITFNEKRGQLPAEAFAMIPQQNC